MLIFKLDSETDTLFSSVWIDRSFAVLYQVSSLKPDWPETSAAFIGNCTIEPVRDAQDLTWHEKEREMRNDLKSCVAHGLCLCIIQKYDTD